MAGDEAFLMTSLALILAIIYPSIFPKEISASDQVEHRFRFTGPSAGLFLLLSPEVVEDAGDDDVLRRDAAGIKCRTLQVLHTATIKEVRSWPRN